MMTGSGLNVSDATAKRIISDLVNETVIINHVYR